MDDQENRLLQIEGQIHGLARAWLYLAAGLEMRELLDPDELERSLLGTHWRGVPLQPYAQQMMQHLVEQLADARAYRQQRSQSLSARLDE